MVTVARYSFKQRFPVPAKRVYQWCTDFDSTDHALMGDLNARRKMAHLNQGTIILTDTFHLPDGTIEKQKLVQLYPDQLFWVSTHLTGPNQYSQFLYAIKPQGSDSSILEFTGVHLDYTDKEDAEALAKRLRKEDSDAWKLLAKAMKLDLALSNKLQKS